MEIGHTSGPSHQGVNTDYPDLIAKTDEQRIAERDKHAPAWEPTVSPGQNSVVSDKPH
jgi:hypothetical protein